MKIITVNSANWGLKHFRVMSDTPILDYTGSFTRTLAYERVKMPGYLVAGVRIDGFWFIGYGCTVRKAALDAGERFKEWRTKLGIARTYAAAVADVLPGITTYEGANFGSVPEENIE